MPPRKRAVATPAKHTPEVTVRPFVQCALLCEKVLVERDNVFSAIRVVDVFYVEELPERGGREKPAMRVSALLSVRGGPGKTIVRFVLRTPGKETTSNPMTIDLPGGKQGTNLILQISIPLHAAGDGALEFHLDGEPAAKIPFQIMPRSKSSASME